MNYNNAFADMFKNSFDFNQIFSTGRRNIEAAAAVNQIATENAQAIARRNSEIARENVETALKASKDLFSGNPEASFSKNADAARSFFETSLSNMREVGEMISKASFEAYDVLNRRAAESMEEFSKASASVAAPKKKSA